MPVNQMNGVHLDLAALASQMPFHTVRDYDNYCERLRQIPRVFDQVTINMRQGIRDKLMPPKYLLEKVAAESQDIGSKPLAASPFTQPLQKFPSGISAVDRRRLTESIQDAVRDKVNPAYLKFATFVHDEYAPHGRIEYGVWALPDGAARYRFDVREETTTNLTAEQIFEMGVKQVRQSMRRCSSLRSRSAFTTSKLSTSTSAKIPTFTASPVNRFWTSTSTTPTRCTLSCRSSSSISLRHASTSFPWKPTALLPQCRRIIHRVPAMVAGRGGSM